MLLLLQVLWQAVGCRHQRHQINTALTAVTVNTFLEIKQLKLKNIEFEPMFYYFIIALASTNITPEINCSK